MRVHLSCASKDVLEFQPRSGNVVIIHVDRLGFSFDCFLVQCKKSMLNKTSVRVTMAPNLLFISSSSVMSSFSVFYDLWKNLDWIQKLQLMLLLKNCSKSVIYLIYIIIAEKGRV